MVKYLAHHTLAFFVLIFLLGLHIVLYVIMPNPNYQFLVFVSAGVSYVGWALMYHAAGHTLKRRIIMEYVMIAALVLVIGFSLLAVR